MGCQILGKIRIEVIENEIGSLRFKGDKELQAQDTHQPIVGSMKSDGSESLYVRHQSINMPVEQREPFQFKGNQVSSLTIEAMGPPVFEVTSYVPASCHAKRT
jgi:hypothetical protein